MLFRPDGYAPPETLGYGGRGVRRSPAHDGPDVRAVGVHYECSVCKNLPARRVAHVSENRPTTGAPR